MTLLLAAAQTKALWYATRGSGTVSLVLLTASVVLGIVTTVGWSSPRLPTFVTQGLHRNVSLLVTIFLALHVATTVIDGFAPIHWLDALVPFASPYRTVWLGLGAVATDVLIAVILTSLVRVRLGFRVWRLVHWLSYLCWPVALIHGLGTGSDTRASWSLALDGFCALLVLAAVWWRLAVRRPNSAVVGLAALTVSVLTPVVVAGWVVTGPLRPSWGHTSNAAATELAAGSGAEGASAGSGSSAPLRGLAAGFTDTFSGRWRQSSQTVGQDVTIDVNGALVGQPGLSVAVALQGRVASGGRVTLQEGEAHLDAANGSAEWQGPVVGLDGDRIDAVLSDSAGRQLTMTFNLRVDRANGTAQGSVLARAA